MLHRNGDKFVFTDSVIHLNFTTRTIPVRKNRETYRNIIENTLGKGRTIFTTKQIHSSIINITRTEGFYLGDGLITDNTENVVSIFTADCYPVLIYSVFPPVLALIHAGWRGTYKNIIGKTVRILYSNYDIKRLKAFIGPGICEKCYTVGEEMKTYFDNDYFNETSNSTKLNLKAIIKDRLKNNNIVEIFDSEYCTVCDNDLFFSYRAENKTENRILTFAFIGKTVRE